MILFRDSFPGKKFFFENFFKNFDITRFLLKIHNKIHIFNYFIDNYESFIRLLVKRIIIINKKYFIDIYDSFYKDSL